MKTITIEIKMMETALRSSSAALLGDWCSDDSECSLLVNSVATCKRNICSCPNGLYPLGRTECGQPPETTTVTVETTAGTTAGTSTPEPSVAATSTTTAVPTTTTTTATTITDTTTITTTEPTTTATTTITTTEPTTTTSTTTVSTTTTVATTTEKPCGGTAETQGRITSPEYPNVYAENTDIFWTVLAEPGHTIEVEITDFALEVDNLACSNFDYLEFRDGDSVTAPSLGRFCGTDFQQTVGATTGDALTIIFHTDHNNQQRGFEIIWKICGAEEGSRCDDADRTGRVQSINYPNKYPASKETHWHLLAAHSRRTFTLIFQEFVLEGSSCNYDWVKIMEDDPAGTSLGPFCGTNKPEPYGPTSGATLSLQMHTDVGTERSGFSAEWTAVCSTGGTGAGGTAGTGGVSSEETGGVSSEERTPTL